MTMFVAGFDVHHLDGNHDNNAPENLVLIEHTDHMRLHGMGTVLGRLTPRRTGPRKPAKPAKSLKRPPSPPAPPLLDRTPEPLSYWQNDPLVDEVRALLDR